MKPSLQWFINLHKHKHNQAPMTNIEESDSETQKKDTNTEKTRKTVEFLSLIQVYPFLEQIANGYKKCGLTSHF